MIYDETSSDESCCCCTTYDCTMEYPCIRVSGTTFYSNAVFCALVNASSMSTLWSASFLKLLGTETAWVHNVVCDGKRDGLASLILQKRNPKTVHVATSIPPPFLPPKEAYEMMVLDSTGNDTYQKWKKCHPYMDKSEYILITHRNKDFVETIMQQHPQLGVDYVDLPNYCEYTVVTITGQKDTSSTLLRSFCERPDVHTFLNTWERTPKHVATYEEIERSLARRFGPSMTLTQVMNLKNKVISSLPVVYMPLRYTNHMHNLHCQQLYDISEMDDILDIL